ncbi:MAG: hypothetical protein KDA75_06270 [Planctomycetaceae bacterium]|nr:hypothetical protein [Planctomycetaceae bacterium]
MLSCRVAQIGQESLVGRVVDIVGQVVGARPPLQAGRQIVFGDGVTVIAAT